ncbi:MAG TPA: hypothetical protein DCL42_12450 [Deltaproteobacteria bacterium]|nr:hypothetical protein [Deltaproteobacteria bacterium]
MSSPKNNASKINKTLEQVMKERFVHSLSQIVYDKVSALWHIDKESEELMSQIASKVVIGMFCLEYLSYINKLVKEKNKVTHNITAFDLSDKDLIEDIKSRLSNKETADSFKKTARLLKKFLDSTDIKTLEGLTQVAHTGDYLLYSLKDMKESNHDEFNLWLSSMPYFYEKDLSYLGLVKSRFDLFPDTYSLESHIDSFWSESLQDEAFDFEKMHFDHRINIDAHLSSEVAKKSYLPSKKSKEKKTYSRG